jgi:hypothetical protein
MAENSKELTTSAILGISAAVAIVGLLAYALIAPVPPSTLIALAHSAVEEGVVR